MDRHLQGSCLKESSWDKNSERLAVWLKEITVVIAPRRQKTLTTKLILQSLSVEGNSFRSCVFNHAHMVKVCSALARPLHQNPKDSPKYHWQTSANVYREDKLICRSSKVHTQLYTKNIQHSTFSTSVHILL